jgi:DNA invertase Pin-like site-specific DNA recombinase
MRYYYNQKTNLQYWMDAEKKIRAAIYTRVSTEDQAKEGFSLDAQLEKLISYCKARDWEIAGEYIDDGYSGRYVKRPAYNRMMEEINKWDAILVIKMDRIHRNSKNFMMMMEYLKKEEKEFVSMSESLDTSTAMGRFLMDIIQRIAQLESEQIGERVYVGMEQKAKTNGGVLGFNIPYGYDYSNGKLTINHNESENVKNIFQNYLNGISMKKIADELNLKSIPTKLNKVWGIQTVSLILKNPVYCGYLHWEDYLNPSDHPPIVDKNSFNEVQKLIQKKNIKTAHQSNTFIIE